MQIKLFTKWPFEKLNGFLFCFLLYSIFVPHYASASTQDSLLPSQKISSRVIPVVDFSAGNEAGYSVSVSETSILASIGVKLSEAQSNDVTFTLVLDPSTTAVNNTDFSIPNPTNNGQTLTSLNVTIPAGKTQSAFTLNIVPRNLYYAVDKVIVFDIINLNGAVITTDTGLLKITISNNNPPPILQFKTTDTTIDRNITNTIPVTIDLLASKNGDPINLSYSIVNSPGLIQGTGNDYIITDSSGNILPNPFVIPAESTDYQFNIEFYSSTLPKDPGLLTIKLLSADNANISDTLNSLSINVLDSNTIQNHLTDTGINTCYDTAGQSVDCQSTDFPGEDGANVTPRSLIKIDAGGNVIIDSSPWDCVYDADTGLLWNVNQVTTNTNPNTYSWYNTASTVNGGDTGTSGGQNSCGSNTPCDTSNFTKIMNAENSTGHCGVSTWRLPTVSELMSILDYQSSDPSLAINTTYFPNVASGSSTYWTNAPVVVLKGQVWCVNFAKASQPQLLTCSKSRALPTRLVSTCRLSTDAKSIACQ